MNPNNIKVGSCMFFGQYKQHYSDDTEPIEWIIGYKETDKALLLSKYVLDIAVFDDFDNKYEQSLLCKWLNNEFYNTAFSKSEQDKMMETSFPVFIDVASSKQKEEFDTDIGNQKDKVFILSVEELNKLKHIKKYLYCQATEYAKSRGVFIDPRPLRKNICWYLLRDPDLVITDVELAHFMIEKGYPIANYFGIGIRPAVWIKLS